MEPRFWIEGILALTIPASVAFVVWHRVAREMGMGIRSLQFLALGVMVPAAIILALEKVLDGAVIGTLFGAVIGYLFANEAKEPK